MTILGSFRHNMLDSKYSKSISMKIINYVIKVEVDGHILGRVSEKLVQASTSYIDFHAMQCTQCIDFVFHGLEKR